MMFKIHGGGVQKNLITVPMNPTVFSSLFLAYSLFFTILRIHFEMAHSSGRLPWSHENNNKCTVYVVAQSLDIFTCSVTVHSRVGQRAVSSHNLVAKLS